MSANEMTPERQFERLMESREHQSGRILGISHSTLRMFAHDRGGNLSLRVMVPEEFNLRRLVSTRGIEVDTETRLGESRELAFISRSPSLDTLFLSFVRFAVDRTAGEEEEAGALGELLDAYDAFRHFMESQKTLSAEALKGLVAELVVMTWLIDRGLSPAAVLSGWKGPFKDNKDFVLPDGRAYEVKSAPYNSDTVRISSPEQLEPNGLMLSLCVARMEKATEGMEEAATLTDLIAGLTGRFASAGVDPAALHVGLEAYGLAPEDEESRAAWFMCRRPVEYGIAAGFPRVGRDAVPRGVSGVNFLVDLSCAKDFLIEDESAVDSPASAVSASTGSAL